MTSALFHSAFGMLGGAEILAATQARCLRNANLDLCLATLELDRARWSSWLEGIPIRVVKKAPLIDRVMSPVRRLQRIAPRVATCLADCHTVLACNYPTNVLLGGAPIHARKVWCCNEPSRDSHLEGANPRLYERIMNKPGGKSAAELNLARRMASPKRKHKSMVDMVNYDIEQTRKMHAVYAISEFSCDTVRRVYGISDAKAIYPIVRFPSHIAAHRSGLDPRGLQILIHSRLEAVKNIDNVLRAFALHAATDPGARLHVVGEGRDQDNLHQLRDELGLGKLVTFHGYLSDENLKAVYAACDVFALLPLDEPFGMVFPEAAARGLLLVGPDHGGPFEIIDGGNLGWACDPFSPESIADAFARIRALSDAEVEQRRAAADKGCRARYSESVVAPQLVELFSDQTNGVPKVALEILPVS